MGSPALNAAQSRRIVLMLNALRAFVLNFIREGIVTAPTSASVQSTGAGGNLAVRVNHSAVWAVIDGVKVYIAAAADYVVHNAAFWSATSGKSAIWAIVVDYNSGTPQISDVAGAEAATGSQVAPTDDEIDTALGHSNWLRLCDLTVNRTADTTVTQTYDMTVQDWLTVADFGGSDLAETEAEFSSQPTVPNP